jgi:hypothetical protein
MISSDKVYRQNIPDQHELTDMDPFLGLVECRNYFLENF